MQIFNSNKAMLMLLLGVSRFDDLRTTENIQVLTQNLCSLYWSRDTAPVIFDVEFVLMATFRYQFGSFVWKCRLVGLHDVKLFC